VSAIKRPDFILQDVYIGTSWLWRCFKNRQMVSCQVLMVSFLPTTGDKVSA
jgi:hypothetical protein